MDKVLEMNRVRLGWLLLIIMLLTACGERRGLAPVEELRLYRQTGYETTHRVRAGETLYAVAFRYDKDYRQLAALNGLHAPYSVQVGQVLRLNVAAKYRQNPSANYSSRSITSKRARSYPKYSQPMPVRSWSKPYNGKGGKWIWPANGRIAGNFVPVEGKKGIDIAGKKGDSIRAAAGGVVAYAGNGLSGYGNLIIIKHDGQILTAYANNQRNRVVEGQKVKAGQIIADMGIVDRKYWGVHFEIRQAGQPVNPLSYLRSG